MRLDQSFGRTSKYNSDGIIPQPFTKEDGEDFRLLFVLDEGDGRDDIRRAEHGTE